MTRFRIGVALLAIGAMTAPQCRAQSFEVASVRLTPKDSLGYTSFGPPGTNRFTISNAGFYLLIQFAYGVPSEQISGLEKLGDGHYDIDAKAEDGVLLTSEQLAPRMRTLLEQRFKLAVHMEMKNFDGYALVAAKGGPKLKPTAGSSESGGIYPGGLRLLNLPLAAFASLLRSTAGRPVVDKTGIQGNYDFSLTYARDNDPDSPLPSFFTAIQEQFGLKLEPAKVPLEIVVIDHVDRVPTEN